MPKPAKPPAKKKAKKKPAAKTPPQTDWVALLRSGEAGVRKWNRLTTAGRAAVSLSGTDFVGYDLAGVNLSSTVAQKTKFRGAKLAGGRFSHGDVTKADFSAADLREADFAHATATGTVFRDATLTSADFTDCDCRKAVFTGADLTGAEFRGSQLAGGDFTGATLAGVVWDGATFDTATTWPADFTPPGELRWCGRGTDPRLAGKGKAAVAHDINGLMARLHAVIDGNRMKRTLDMLKKGKNQLFHEVEPTMIRGIVKSQTEPDKVYSCVLTDDGTYACCSADMAQCMGLRGEPCKHLLVLVIGLARAGALDPSTADQWTVAAKRKNTRWNKAVQNHMADSLLKYKGAQAGEIDWRPTETIPEDYYAL